MQKKTKHNLIVIIIEIAELLKTRIHFVKNSVTMSAMFFIQIVQMVWKVNWNEKKILFYLG